jgi:DNA-binding MarR family transcriptional regulator
MKNSGGSAGAHPPPSAPLGGANQVVTVRLGPGVAPVRRTLAGLTRRVNQIAIAMTAGSLAEAGLTPLQYGAMGCLNRRDGEPGIDQMGLAARLGIDRNSASVLVEELAIKGLIERRVKEEDRRARVLQLTGAGERLFLQLRKNNLAAQERILEILTPSERELLFDLLVRIIAANGQHARPGAGRRKRGSQKSPPKSQGRPSLFNSH